MSNKGISTPSRSSTRDNRNDMNESHEHGTSTPHTTSRGGNLNSGRIPSEIHSTGSLSISSTSTYAGWLLKKRENIPVRQWRGRWVVLVGRQLRYYESKSKNASSPRAVLYLAQGTIIDVEDFSRSGKSTSGKGGESIQLLDEAALPPFSARSGNRARANSSDSEGQSTSFVNGHDVVSDLGDAFAEAGHGKVDFMDRAGSSGPRELTPITISPNPPEPNSKPHSVIVIRHPDMKEVYRFATFETRATSHSGLSAADTRDQWVAVLRAAAAGLFDEAFMFASRRRILPPADADTPTSNTTGTTSNGTPKPKSHLVDLGDDFVRTRGMKVQNARQVVVSTALRTQGDSAGAPSNFGTPVSLSRVQKKSVPKIQRIKKVTYKNAPFQPAKLPPAPAYAEATEEALKKLRALGSSSYEGWKANGEKDNVKLFVTDDGNPGARGDAHIPLSRKAIFAVVTNNDHRKATDAQFDMATEIDSWNGNQNKLVHLIFKGVPPFVAKRDFCTIVHWQFEEDGTLLVVSTSVTHPKVPVTDTPVRATLHVGGWLLRPRPGLEAARKAGKLDKPFVLPDGSVLPDYLHPAVDADGVDATYLMRSNLNGDLPTSIVVKVTEKQALLPGIVRDYIRKNMVSGGIFGPKFNTEAPLVANYGQDLRGETIEEEVDVPVESSEAPEIPQMDLPEPGTIVRAPEGTADFVLPASSIGGPPALFLSAPARPVGVPDTVQHNVAAALDLLRTPVVPDTCRPAERPPVAWLQPECGSTLRPYFVSSSSSTKAASSSTPGKILWSVHAGTPLEPAAARAVLTGTPIAIASLLMEREEVLELLPALARAVPVNFAAGEGTIKPENHQLAEENWFLRAAPATAVRVIKHMRITIGSNGVPCLLFTATATDGSLALAIELSSMPASPGFGYVSGPSSFGSLVNEDGKDARDYVGLVSPRTRATALLAARGGANALFPGAKAEEAASLMLLALDQRCTQRLLGPSTALFAETRSPHSAEEIAQIREQERVSGRSKLDVGVWISHWLFSIASVGSPSVDPLAASTGSACGVPIFGTSPTHPSSNRQATVSAMNAAFVTLIGHWRGLLGATNPVFARSFAGLPLLQVSPPLSATLADTPAEGLLLTEDGLVQSSSMVSQEKPLRELLLRTLRVLFGLWGPLVVTDMIFKEQVTSLLFDVVVLCTLQLALFPGLPLPVGALALSSNLVLFRSGFTSNVLLALVLPLVSRVQQQLHLDWDRAAAATVLCSLPLLLLLSLLSARADGRRARRYIVARGQQYLKDSELPLSKRVLNPAVFLPGAFTLPLPRALMNTAASQQSDLAFTKPDLSIVINGLTIARLIVYLTESSGSVGPFSVPAVVAKALGVALAGPRFNALAAGLHADNKAVAIYVDAPVVPSTTPSALHVPPPANTSPMAYVAPLGNLAAQSLGAIGARAWATSDSLPDVLGRGRCGVVIESLPPRMEYSSHFSTTNTGHSVGLLPAPLLSVARALNPLIYVTVCTFQSTQQVDPKGGKPNIPVLYVDVAFHFSGDVSAPTAHAIVDEFKALIIDPDLVLKLDSSTLVK